MRVDGALANCLRENGVDTLFGVIADPTMRFAHAFSHECGGRFVAAAHEAGATHMAFGHGAMSQGLGAALIDLGPGLTNSLTAVVDAVKGRAPLLLIYPDTHSAVRNHRQDVPQRDLIMATGAGFEQMRSPELALEDLAKAIRRALYESRPVALNIPREFLDCEIDYRSVRAEPLPAASPQLDEDSLDRAVGLLASVNRPVVLAGRGAIAARDAVLALADRLGAPVATSLGAKSLFLGEPANLGIMGNLSQAATIDLLTQADCIIAFGAGLNTDTSAQGSFTKDKRVVQCDIASDRLGMFCRIDAPVVGDAAEVARTMMDWLDSGEIPPTDFRERAISQLAAHVVEKEQPPTAGTVNLRLAIRAIDAAIPRDRIFVGDPSRHASVTWPEIHVDHPGNFVLTGHFAAIGTGIPIAIGAGCARPGRDVLAVCGDGAFMLGGLVEFNTAVREGVDLVVVVCNDRAYGPEHEKLLDFGLSPDIAEFDWPDFGPVAEALGGIGVTVGDQDALDGACRMITDGPRPLLIDLKLDPYQMPETAR
jgi:thiamine pyrophosphate-dependent acetolactate synthase large subunit-like protein